MTKPGIYQHYKGGFYRVLFTAHDSTNLRCDSVVVVYISLTTGRVNVRDETEFHESVNVNAAVHASLSPIIKEGPRFKWHGENL